MTEPLRVAIVGKGGAGKSVIAGTLARLLARDGRDVLALDSDPMPGLTISLGMGVTDDRSLEEVVERGDDNRWRFKKGLGPARALRRCAVEGPDGIRLLQFGKAGSSGMGAVMGSLNGFHKVVHRLVSTRAGSEWDIVGDLSAGPRQAAFNWAPYADLHAVIVEPNWKSILSARRIARIARANSRAVFVGNKIRNDDDVELIEDALDERLIASIAFSDEVLL
ncbi:MAG: hypothetical protein ACLGHL_11140, partial [Actinomycetota bacterium]